MTRTSTTHSLVSALVFAAIVVAAGWLRFEQLGVKPLHHDEGVNGWFLLRLAHEGEYRYNPDNYHGPSLYYLTLPAQYLLGESEQALRSVPAAFGLLAVCLLWLLRRRLGPVGTPAAAMLMAFSAGLVYFSRDFIHEMLFGCFTLGTVTGAVRYIDERRFRWMLLSATSLGLLFATKETAIVVLPIIGLAALIAIVVDQLRRGQSPRLRDVKIGGGWLALDQTIAGAVIFLFLNLLLYSSFFTHPDGVIDAIRSPWRWTMRSGSEHVKGFWYYAAILVKLELPILLCALAGGALVLWRGTRFWLFVGAWSVGSFLAYSLIGYKTPWLIVGTLIPMTLLGGHALQRLYDRLPSPIVRLALALPLLAGFVFSAWLTREVSLVHHDDNQNRSGFFADVELRPGLRLYSDELVGYVYAQTDRELLNLLGLIKEETAAVGQGIYVASPDYWPLPWYLRDYAAVDYSGALPVFDASGNPGIGHRMIIARKDQLTAFANAGGFRVSPTSYILRPGVALVLLVRDDVNDDIKNESEPNR